MTQTPPLFPLQVALDANAAAYRRAVQTSAPGDCWDVVVLTAANERQAAGYRQELALRHRAVGTAGAFFPAITQTLVVPDPPGRRAGSGGATLGVMRALVDDLRVPPERLADLRVLLIHSGGASQRLPMYSPVGKIFAPLPLLRPDGQIATLFDHLFLTLSGLPERLGPGMLVLAGDVFLLFDHRHVSTPPAGVTALTMRVEAETGRGHGVFVTRPSDGTIRKTLQKISADQMRAERATDADGRVLIDTGLLFFDAERTRLLARLAGVSAPRRPAHFSDQARRRAARRGLHERYAHPLDLYEDVTAALAADTVERDFLSAAPTRAQRRELWRLLHGVPFRAMELAGEFLHLGTTRQFRDAMTGHNPSPAAELFQQDVLAHSEWPAEPGGRVYHSVLLADGGETGALGGDSVVEHSILRGDVRIGAGSVVSQSALTGAIRVAPGRLLFQVPIRAGETGRRTRARGGAIDGAAAVTPETTDIWFVHVVCGVEDDFKGKLAGGQCRYLNEPVEQWFDEKRIDPDDVWPDVPADRRTLWNAALFPATPRRDGVAQAVAWLERGRMTAADRRRWRAARRYSMAMLLEAADPAALIEHRDVISARLQTAALLERVRRGDDVPADAILGRYVTPTAYYAVLDGLGDATCQAPAEAATAVWQARALWSGAELLGRPDHPTPGRARPQIDAYRDAAFARVADASEIGHADIRVAAPNGVAKSLAPGVEVTATAPVRLDLAGGWTDTPPYCFERGGHVVNVAIDLDGRPPVRAVVRTLAEPHLVLQSHDLGREVRVAALDAGRPDVRDPFALHKVALAMTGFASPAGGDVARHLRRLGAGLHVTTECRVPKGSGLGTSSILAAALLAALHRARGARVSTAQLLEQTLLLEQRLGTGGGWQDQVGGAVGGVKSTVTAPGVPQRLGVERLPLSNARLAGLEERLVVYYSGQQRLARDILRRVMGRWLGREPAVIALLNELKRNAAAQRDALLKGRWLAVGREAARYWRIKKDLYPASTTPTIDVLLLELQSFYVGAGLAGAGGGGFAYFICRDARQASRLRDALAERAARPGSLGSVYATRINREGLKVTSRRIERTQ
jgi:fucokinase